MKYCYGEGFQNLLNRNHNLFFNVDDLLAKASDPWRACELIFDENKGHFIQRAKDRSYSGPIYRDFLIMGKKEEESKKQLEGQDYKVTYGKWVIKCKVRDCNIIMGTIY